MTARGSWSGYKSRLPCTPFGTPPEGCSHVCTVEACYLVIQDLANQVKGMPAKPVLLGEVFKVMPQA